jgi:hypothetical protein
MSAKFIKTEHVEKSNYKDFKVKATDFYHGIEVAQEARLWHTMGVTAVHATISIGDALKIAKQAQRFYDWAIKQLP